MTLRELIQWAQDVDKDILDYKIRICCKRKLTPCTTIEFATEIMSIDDNVNVDEKLIICRGI